MIPFETHARLLESQLRMFDIIRYICIYIYVSRRLRRTRKQWWVRPWLTVEKRHNFGLYGQLMLELRCEDKNAIHNFMRMPTEMFDELLRRVDPCLEKKTTKWWTALNPGLELAICFGKFIHGHGVWLACTVFFFFKNGIFAKIVFFPRILHDNSKTNNPIEFLRIFSKTRDIGY